MGNNKIQCPDSDQIQQWLVSNIAQTIEVNPLELDVREPFTSFGLTSLDELGLSGDLENWLGIKIPPTITWDYPTIVSLSVYLADKVKPCQARASDDVNQEVE
jgi:acyl carrier protein